LSNNFFCLALDQRGVTPGVFPKNKANTPIKSLPGVIWHPDMLH